LYADNGTQTTSQKIKPTGTSKQYTMPATVTVNWDPASVHSWKGRVTEHVVVEVYWAPMGGAWADAGRALVARTAMVAAAANSPATAAWALFGFHLERCSGSNTTQHRGQPHSPRL
jgi:hypothetical protein